MSNEEKFSIIPMIIEIDARYTGLNIGDKIQFEVEFTKKKRPKKRRRSKDTINRDDLQK